MVRKLGFRKGASSSTTFRKQFLEHNFRNDSETCAGTNNQYLGFPLRLRRGTEEAPACRVERRVWKTMPPRVAPYHATSGARVEKNGLHSQTMMYFFTINT